MRTNQQYKACSDDPLTMPNGGPLTNKKNMPHMAVDDVRNKDVALLSQTLDDQTLSLPESHPG